MLCSITEQLTSEKLQAVKLWITAGPREKFTAADLELLKQRLDSGGGLLVMLREGGELKYDTNINFLLEEYGIMVNNGLFWPSVSLSISLTCVQLTAHLLCFNTKAGKLAVLGSCHMFSDQYLDKEENSRIMITDYTMLPDTGSLSERLRVCLREADENPPDFTSLFDMSLLKLHTNALPSVLELELPSVLQPAFRDLPPPKPDLSDLDETFPSEKVRLAQLSNKCTDDDLEFYVRKSGDILGVTGKLDKDKRDAKHILEHVVFQVVEFKKLSEVS
ncbi:hypothetical protein cypCar_00013524 [Cyprinus carpio]|nr:hypothetical protein cypCar_00013524 [Cyprinus carpio]